MGARFARRAVVAVLNAVPSRLVRRLGARPLATRALRPVVNALVPARATTEVPGVPTVNVECSTLDALVTSGQDRPRLAKIDAEGSEADVLHGATALARDLNVIFVAELFSAAGAAMLPSHKLTRASDRHSVLELPA